MVLFRENFIKTSFKRKLFKENMFLIFFKDIILQRNDYFFGKKNKLTAFETQNVGKAFAFFKNFKNFN
jgi:hypothetical protein